jgi:hypothetical protein
MKITAVVCTFWPERWANVGVIVRDLFNGTRPPDRVIVLNNGGHQTGTGGKVDWYPQRFGLDLADQFSDGRLCFVEGGTNWECRGKYIVGLLDPADCYLLLDDDTSVGPRTVEALERNFTARPDVHVTGYWGVILQPRMDGGKSFHGGQIVGAFDWVPVHAFHGRYLFCRREAIVNMLAAEERVRRDGKWTNGEGDDLLIGLANKGHSWMTPLGSGEQPVDLSEEGVAMCHAEGYFEMRDVFLNDALAALA